VLVFDPSGKGRRVYASGIRNCVGMAINPTTGDLWCSTNERDGQITNRICKVTGLRITLHQYRHAVAAVYLKDHPGDYETVRRFLGHRNMRTTVNFYCGLETIQASRMLNDVIRRHRKSLGHPAETGERP
jgi:integrase